MLTNVSKGDKMNKEDCIRIEKPKDKQNTVVLSFRIWPHMSKWMREQNLSPRAILIEGCKELGYDPEESK